MKFLREKKVWKPRNATTKRGPIRDRTYRAIEGKKKMSRRGMQLKGKKIAHRPKKASKLDQGSGKRTNRYKPRRGKTDR